MVTVGRKCDVGNFLRMSNERRLHIVQLAMQVLPLPAAVFGWSTFEETSRGIQPTQLQGGGCGCHIAQISFPAFPFFALSGLFGHSIGTITFGTELVSFDFSRPLLRLSNFSSFLGLVPLPEDAHKSSHDGERTGNTHGCERGITLTPPDRSFRRTDRPRANR